MCELRKIPFQVFWFPRRFRRSWPELESGTWRGRSKRRRKQEQLQSTYHSLDGCGSAFEYIRKIIIQIWESYYLCFIAWNMIDCSALAGVTLILYRIAKLGYSDRVLFVLLLIELLLRTAMLLRMRLKTLLD